MDGIGHDRIRKTTLTRPEGRIRAISRDARGWHG